MGKFEELKEIITLSKETGISLSEAIGLYKDYNQASSEDNKPAPVENGKEKTEEQDSGKEQPQGAQQNETKPQDNDKVIEYKKKVEDLEKKISDLQKANTQRDVSGQDTRKTDEELVNELTRSFM